jgi:hypothetical protein
LKEIVNICGFLEKEINPTFSFNNQVLVLPKGGKFIFKIEND